MKKQVYTTTLPNGGWRQHSPDEEDTIIKTIGENNLLEYPTKEEANDSWNTLMGWCVSQGMQGGNYTSDRLCDELKKYIPNLQ